MAYLTARNPRQTLLTGAEGAPAPTAGSPLEAAPSQPQGSGGFTDFRAYLNANGDAAKALAAKFTGGLDSEAQAAANAKPGGASGAAASPITRAGQAATPSPFDYGAANQKRRDAGAKIDAAGSDAGVKTLLGEQAGPGYTAGMANLDDALFNGAGGRQQMDALRTKYAGLLAPLTPPTAAGPVTPSDAHPMGPTQPAKPKGPPGGPNPPKGYEPGDPYPKPTSANPGGVNPDMWWWNTKTGQWEPKYRRYPGGGEGASGVGGGGAGGGAGSGGGAGGGFGGGGG